LGRKRKKKQLTIKDPESLAILGVICMVLSALLLISLFATSEVLDIFRRYFGYGVVVMSTVLFIAALRLFGTRGKYNSIKVVIFLIIFMFTFLGWVHLLVDIDSAKEVAQRGEYGGIIGYNIAEALRQKLSIEGAFVSLGILMLISFLAALDVSPKQLGEWIVKFLSFVGLVLMKFRDIGIKIFKFFAQSKAKIDNLEMNILNNKGKKAESNPLDINNLSKNEVFSPMDSDALAIKMVSDISGKKESISLFTPELAVKVNNREIPPKPAITNTMLPKREPAEPAQQLDLSVRNYPDWQLPTLDILDPIKPKQQDSKDVIDRKARAILETLRSFNIEAKILGYSIGPSVTQYFIDPAAGIKFSKIANLSKDLALTLASPSDLRIELVPGKSYIGIDVPNDIRSITQLKESIEPVFQNSDKYNLGLAVGIDVTGQPVCRDLQTAPHMLVAGATGQGKSVLINAFIVSMLMRKTPDELKFIMIDPKMVEMAPYDGIPHLLTSPITDMSKASTALKWAVNEMEERYKLLKEARVRNIEDYVSQTGNLMPYLVIIIDEFADLMMQYRQEVESSIIRIAQKARAVGIHLIIATQRPTADVITGLIRSNIPTRVALTVATGIDSRVILDTTGAETLLGKGDLLFKAPNDLKPIRIQGLLLPDKGPESELHRILRFIKEQAPDVIYNEDQILTVPSENGGADGDFASDDPLFKQAAEIVISAQKGSASLLQTKMKIGYARAARLVDELEMAGIVGPQDGPRPREVLVTDFDTFFNGQQTEE
jgi:S-DNA-T family DNA segregation ATPase FtsK/SpoIIIE